MLKLMPAPPTFPPLTVKEAAAALGRSETWVRDHLATGFLERDAMSAGRIMISAASIERAKPLRQAPIRRRLRLVVDNTSGAMN